MSDFQHFGGPTVFIFREEENGSRRFLLKVI
jgi:hypothetical protein